MNTVRRGVSDTSRLNYHQHRDCGALGRQCAELYAFLRDGRQYSRAELAAATRMRLSSVCGRVNELIAKDLLREGPTRSCRVTGRTIHPVFRPTDLEQLHLFQPDPAPSTWRTTKSVGSLGGSGSPGANQISPGFP